MFSFLYVLVSGPNDSHADKTAVSATFLRDVHPDARIMMLCNVSTHEHLKRCRHPLIGLVDHIVEKEAPHEDAQANKQHLKSRMRELIDGDFLYLDSDTLVVNPLDEVFKVKNPVALAHNHNHQYPDNFPGSEMEYYRKCGWSIPSDGIYLNAGVIFWRSCPEAMELSRHYQHTIDAMHRNGLMINDQPAFNWAVELWGGEVGILPDRYNAQVGANPLSGLDASLWHFNESVGPGKTMTFFNEGLELISANGYLDSAFIQKARASRIHFHSRDKDQENRLIDVLKIQGGLRMRDLLAITDSIPIPTCPRTFCTIITSNYLPYALNLLNSIRDYDQDVHVNILISDSSRLEFDAKTPDSESFFKFPEDVTSEGIGLKIMDKYRDLHHDTFRWSCKSIFINHLILECGYKKVIYVDCDIFFFSPFSFLFDALDTHRVLLTPHWRTPHPNCNPEEYRLLFSDGLYNAGFIGVNSNAVDVMDWWAETCLYSCAKASFPGEYVDQSILNMMPLYFEGVHVLRHKGCNVAVWNQHVCRRTMKPDGSILINDEFPIVFVHFVSKNPKEFDPMLSGYFDRYMKNLRSFSLEAFERETINRRANHDNDFSNVGEEDMLDKGLIHKLMVKVSMANRKRKEILYWRIKKWVIGTYLALRRWNHSENIAILTQQLAYNHCLGLWLRESQGTILASRPIADKHCSADMRVDEAGISSDILRQRCFQGATLNLEALAKARLVDPVHVSWSSWESLLGVKRMVLNLPLDLMDKPGLSQQLAKHCRLVALLVHPCSNANRRLLESRDARSEALLQEAEARIMKDDALRAFTGENPSKWVRWVVKWCMDVEDLMEAQRRGERIFIVLQEWLQWDTQRALNRLCKSLSMTLPEDLESRFPDFCTPCKSMMPVKDRLTSEYYWEDFLEAAGHENVDGVLRHFGIYFYSSRDILPTTHMVPEPLDGGAVR